MSIDTKQIKNLLEIVLDKLDREEVLNCMLVLVGNKKYFKALLEIYKKIYCFDTLEDLEFFYCRMLSEVANAGDNKWKKYIRKFVIEEMLEDFDHHVKINGSI